MQAPAVIGFLSFRSVKAHAAACTPAGEPHEPAPLLRSRPLAGGSIGVGIIRRIIRQSLSHLPKSIVAEKVPVQFGIISVFGVPGRGQKVVRYGPLFDVVPRETSDRFSLDAELLPD